MVKMKVKEAEKILGRKMSLKEKIGFRLAQHKIKREQKKKEEGKNTPGQDAFIVSLIAICSIVIPYVGIVAFPLAIVSLIMGINAKKKDPKDKKANLAIILSIVKLGLFVLAAIVLALVIAAFTI